MEALFLKLLNMSLAAGWMVLVVLLLRLALRRAPRWAVCLLWGLVALRLVCPVSVESSLSLLPEKVGSGELVEEWADDYVGEVWVIHDNSIYYDGAVAAGREPIPSGEGGYYVVTAPDQLGEPSTVENTVVPVLSWVWLAGMSGMLLYALVSYLLLKRRMATATLLRDHIKQSESVDSPFVLGLFRPAIYLPYAIDGEDMAHVIAHEQAHIRRRDHWWKPIGFLLLSVHWFNPMLWVAYVLLCRDIEAACDEKVIADMEREERRAYSTALLNCSVHRRRIAACPLAFGEVGVKERIKNVMDYKKPAFWIVAVAVAACLAAGVCFLTDPPLLALDLEDNPIQSAHCFDVREGGPEGPARPLTEEEIEDLTYRLKGLNGTRRDDAYAGLTAAYQISAALKDGSYVRASGYHMGNLSRVDVEWQGERYVVEDLSFHFYLDEVCRKRGAPSGEKRPLTLDDVTALSQKGDALTWADFEDFDYIETGSGLYIRAYDIDEMFTLLIGGAGPDSDPMYIYLRSNYTRDGRIDIRFDDVEAFIAEQRALRANYLAANDPLPGEFPMGMIFASGAGGWGSSLTLYPDGTFVGSYSDSEMGDTGEGYPNGTHYTCAFTGRFSDIKKRDGHAYDLTLAELATELPERTVWYEDGIRYVASFPYGLANSWDFSETTRFILYTPETKPGEVSEDFLSWWPEAYLWQKGERDTLSCYGLYNVHTGAGFFSHSSTPAQGEQTRPDGLDVQEAMRTVNGADFPYPEDLGSASRDKVSEALRDAADDRIPGSTLNGIDYWQMDVYLEGDPDHWTNQNLHFELRCGLEENVVEVALCKQGQRSAALFRSEALYDLVRHKRDYGEVVDQAAFDRFAPILTGQMDTHFAYMSGFEGYKGYELTRFNRVWRYSLGNGGEVELYDFDYALLPQDVERVTWAGGMYLDSKLRVQGHNGGGQFAVRYQDGQVIKTAFMGNDFYYTPDQPENTVWAKEMLGGVLGTEDECFLTPEEIQQVNGAFTALLRDEQENPISVNPASCFFTSLYDRVEELNFSEFLWYFPGGVPVTDEAEFNALKGLDRWSFGEKRSLKDMPVPIQRHTVDNINAVLTRYAGITMADLSAAQMDGWPLYLSEYDAYYTFTSDMGAGSFECAWGLIKGSNAYLYQERDWGTTLLTLRKVGDNWYIQSHQLLEG